MQLARCCLFKHSGFSPPSKTVHCTENRILFSAVYWIVQQDKRASPLHNGIHHPPSQTRFPSLASSPRNFLCIDYALEVGRARTHKQGLGYWCHVKQYLPPWCIPNVQSKSNQYQKDWYSILNMACLHLPPSEYNTEVLSPKVKQPEPRLIISAPPHMPSCCGQGQMYLLSRLYYWTLS